jgi:pyruvate/2-oxoglutarate dehydrogenase complex dihydrolipoamide dehydrogenase (E3) component
LRKNLIIVAVIAVALAGIYLFERQEFFNIDYFRNLHLRKSGVTAGILFTFILIAALPFLTRALIAFVNRRRVYRPYQRPSHYDANLLVIGGGSAGLVTALIATAVRARVILVEKARMGGDCLNTGCVPSKSLIRAARTVKDIREAGNFGIEVGDHTVDFAQVMAKIQNTINTIAPHDSVERYTELGVECVSGQAVIMSPWEVQVGKRTIRAKTIVIASGAEPFVPPIPGIENVDYLTCDNLWELREQPRKMLVLGAGPVGCELAQAFQRLGTQVTLVDMMSQVLPREDADVSEFIAGVLKDEGVELLLNHETIGFEDHAGRSVAIFEARDLNSKTEEAGDQRTLAFDKCLVAVGRKATISGMGLEDLGIELTPQGTLAVDDCLRTRFPNILGCGDVVGPYQFTHAASHQGWYAAVNGLFGALKRFRVDYSVMPWTTFTDPEVAHVGLSEKDAKIQNIAYELTQYSLSELDRAIVEGVTAGFVKVLTVPGKDRILGVSIVGAHAGELLTEFVSAMKSKRGLNTILGVIHAYPTFSEANRMVAGIWRRNHPPQNLLNLAARYHRWRLGGNS